MKFSFNLTAIHYVMAVCGALAATIPNVESNFPAAWTPYENALVGVLAITTAILGAISSQGISRRRPTVDPDAPTDPGVGTNTVN